MTEECSTAVRTTVVPDAGAPGDEPEQPAVDGIGARWR